MPGGFRDQGEAGRRARAWAGAGEGSRAQAAQRGHRRWQGGEGSFSGLEEESQWSDL